MQHRCNKIHEPTTKQRKTPRCLCQHTTRHITVPLFLGASEETSPRRNTNHVRILKPTCTVAICRGIRCALCALLTETTPTNNFSRGRATNETQQTLHTHTRTSSLSPRVHKPSICFGRCLMVIFLLSPLKYLNIHTWNWALTQSKAHTELSDRLE